MMHRVRRLAAAVSLLLVVAAGAARGAALPLPPFSQWETITGGAKVALEDGRIVEAGETHAFFSDPREERTKAFLRMISAEQ